MSKMGIIDNVFGALRMGGGYEDDDYDMMDDDELDEDDGEFVDDDPTPRRSIFDRLRAARSQEPEDDEEDYEDDYDDDEPDEPEQRTSRTTGRSSGRENSRSSSREQESERAGRRTSSSKITPMRTNRRMSMNSSSMEVCVIKPNSMEDTEVIADTLLDNATVILNLEGIDPMIAQRVFDFTSGCCYSIGGTLTKVSSYIFILGPANVDITGDLQAAMQNDVLGAVGAGY